MIRGQFPAPWHNLNVSSMEDNILKRASAELKEAGCRVFVWQDDTYNRGWSKGDYIMLYYAFPDSPNIGYLSHGEYGMSVAYSRAYIPSCGSGSGCGIKEEATFDLETALDVLNGPLPRWCRSYGVYPKQYDNIDKWYKLIEDNKNERVSYIHNNINLDHYLKSDKPYLISWNKSRVDSPIYDLLSFYKNHYLEFDFDDLFHYYESNYPLKDNERLLLFIYMAIPPKIVIDGSEYDMCIKINKNIEYLYKTSNLIMNYQK